jgi:arsenical pump membrane protein
MGSLTAGIVMVSKRDGPMPIAKDISWSILPLVAGLFVFVEALSATGVIGVLARTLREAVQADQTTAAWSAGGILALACKLMNNLPDGVIAITFSPP